MPKFNQTSCSECGKDLGPGDHGLSSCDDHPCEPVVYTKNGHTFVFHFTRGTALEAVRRAYALVLNHQGVTWFDAGVIVCRISKSHARAG